jgi:hypothetical protein
LKQVTVPPEQPQGIIGVRLAQVRQFGEQGIVALGSPRTVANPRMHVTGGEAVIDSRLYLSSFEPGIVCRGGQSSLDRCSANFPCSDQLPHRERSTIEAVVSRAFRRSTHSFGFAL